ncbi:Bro-N domain-containing protein [Methylobacterium sp. P1-11]|uniref:BRO-N domain-containing protein n=1 Tax=Methylobacterium sp. P1-11 TaxID=2024616 RepID=UPI001FF0394D|nr:Bro-N domain-containing protein [Methylobacterium sp. P1-11]
MKNDCLDAVTAVLDELGIAYAVGRGGKHHRIDFEVNGRRCRTTAPVTPSDHRAALNGASQVRRIIRQAQEETAADQEAPMTVAQPAGPALALFFENAPIRVIDIDGSMFFVGKDVAEQLGYTNPSKAMADHCKGVTKRYPLSTSGGVQEVRVLSEPDVLRLIVKSNLPAALRFERWVFEEVLPTIRKHGAYASDPALMRQIEELSAKLANVEAAADLALEAAGRIEMGKLAPTVDLASTVTSDDLISLAGIKPGQRVRGTSAFVTGRVLTFTAGHGCFKTPAHLNPSMPWRFPREKGTEWLFGAQLGAEQIRNQIDRQRRKKAQRTRPSHQGHLSLVGAP